MKNRYNPVNNNVQKNEQTNVNDTSNAGNLNRVPIPKLKKIIMFTHQARMRCVLASFGILKLVKSDVAEKGYLWGKTGNRKTNVEYPRFKNCAIVEVVIQSPFKYYDAKNDRFIVPQGISFNVPDGYQPAMVAGGGGGGGDGGAVNIYNGPSNSDNFKTNGVKFTITPKLLYEGEVGEDEQKEKYIYYSYSASAKSVDEPVPFNPSNLQKPLYQIVKFPENPISINAEELKNIMNLLPEDIPDDGLHTWWFRHGQATHNPLKRAKIFKYVTPNYYDTPLTDTGVKQAQTAGDYINSKKLLQNNDIIPFVSDLKRTGQTAANFLRRISDGSPTLYVLPCSHEISNTKTNTCDGETNLGTDTPNIMTCQERTWDGEECNNVYGFTKEWSFYDVFYNSKGWQRSRRGRTSKIGRLFFSRQLCRNTNMLSLATLMSKHIDTLNHISTQDLTRYINGRKSDNQVYKGDNATNLRKTMKKPRPVDIFDKNQGDNSVDVIPNPRPVDVNNMSTAQLVDIFDKNKGDNPVDDIPKPDNSSQPPSINISKFGQAQVPIENQEWRKKLQPLTRKTDPTSDENEAAKYKDLVRLDKSEKELKSMRSRRLLDTEPRWGSWGNQLAIAPNATTVDNFDKFTKSKGFNGGKKSKGKRYNTRKTKY